MAILESGDNVQRGLAAAVGGLAGGLLGGIVPLVCCLFYLVGGGISAAALRFQHGGPVSPKEGAVIGALGGIISGILGGLISFLSSYFWFGAMIGQSPTLTGGIAFVISIPLGIVLGAAGGALIAKLYK